MKYLVVALIGCSSAQRAPVGMRAATALGGERALRGIVAVEIEGTARRFEPGQSPAPGRQALDMPVSTITYKLDDQRAADQFRITWRRDVAYPYPARLDYTTTIVGDRGVIEGRDGVFSPPRAPMRAENVATLRKERWLSSPEMLVLRAIEAGMPAPDELYRGARHHVIAIPIAGSVRPIRVFFDSAGLPAKIDTLEDDPIAGDALVEVELDDWRTVSGVRFPFQLTHKVAGRIVEAETRTSIVVRAGTPARFEIGAAPADPTGTALGARASQWFLRMHAYGIPHHDRQLPVTVVELAPGVLHLAGGTHHSFVVEMDEHLVVVEAPLYEERTAAVLATLAARWPTKPVRFVIATHFHDDHAGGLRAYAAIGATIVTSSKSRAAVDAYLRAPHTVHPDALAQHLRPVERLDVVDKLVLGTGRRTIELRAIANTHADDMHTERFLMTSDIYSPGGVPAPFEVFAAELLAYIEAERLAVDRLGGTHGGVGSRRDLEQVLAK